MVKITNTIKTYFNLINSILISWLKKSMLAKNIAEFHGKETRAVNQGIQRKRERFNNYVDVIDLNKSQRVMCF